jgi:hypothetical protein
MNRDYADGVTAEDIQFFVGIEVEHTAAYGMKTLFVTGVHPADTILSMAEEHDVKHIYFGANQSFPKLDVNDINGWRPWEDMITTCLKQDYWVTLDFDVSCAEGVLEGGFNEYRKFISMISVKLPYLTQFNYNATIKIDDKDFEATNPGVWTHRLHDLLDVDKFTDWDQYKEDEITE